MKKYRKIRYLIPLMILPPYGCVVPCVYYDPNADKGRRWGIKEDVHSYGDTFIATAKSWCWYVWWVGIIGFWKWRHKES